MLHSAQSEERKCLNGNGVSYYKVPRLPLPTYLCVGQIVMLKKVKFSSPDADNYQIAWTAAFLVLNIAVILLGGWRCFANNYLHWAAAATWILLVAQGIANDLH